MPVSVFTILIAYLAAFAAICVVALFAHRHADRSSWAGRVRWILVRLLVLLAALPVVAVLLYLALLLACVIGVLGDCLPH